MKESQTAPSEIDAINLADYIREIPDFPKPGIRYKDITPLLAHTESFALATQQLAKLIAPHQPDKLLAIESRGFIFGAALALHTGLPLYLIRKPGKLPGEVIGQSYDLEYGQDRLEAHTEIFETESSYAIIDDLIATGGTAQATADLVRAHGCRVACCAFLVELTALKGRDRLGNCPIESLIRYD